MEKDSVACYEQEYSEAVRFAMDQKRKYLTEALRQEEMTHLKALGYNGWSPKEREAAYKREVLPYWEKFGIAPEQFWFELYGTRDNRMDPRFLPADLYFCEILPYLNNGDLRYGLANKAYLDYLFHDVNQPQTVVLNMEGVYCDEKRNLIGEDAAIALCLERGTDLFVKVSYGKSGGSGIHVIRSEECTEDAIRAVFRKAGPSFIVQERVRQHPALDTINSNSVCTIRVLSLLLEDKVYIESGALRISAPDTPYMKIYDGGVTTEILEDGSLHPKVFSDLGKWYDNGKGYFDDSFRVPSLRAVYDEVRRIHPRVGCFKCIGWDFAVDIKGDPILLEFNVFPALGCTQITRCKAVFNGRTDWVLEDYFQKRKWADNHRQDILIQ